MSDTNEVEALKARVKELEAAPAPVSGSGGLLSLVGSVVALVPRWLVVAAGVVAVGFFGAEAYLKIRAQWAQTTITENDSRLKQLKTDVGTMVRTQADYDRDLCGDAETRRLFCPDGKHAKP